MQEELEEYPVSEELPEIVGMQLHPEQILFELEVIFDDEVCIESRGFSQSYLDNILRYLVNQGQLSELHRQSASLLCTTHPEDAQIVAAACLKKLQEDRKRTGLMELDIYLLLRYLYCVVLDETEETINDWLGIPETQY